MPGEVDVLEENAVAGVLKDGVDGELLGKPNGEAVGKGDPFLSAATFPPFICAVGPPNGVVGDGFGTEGVDDVNENTALGGGLKSEVPGPVFGKPNEGETVVVDLLPNINDADDARLDPKAELSGAVAATEVEQAAQGKIELGLEAVEPIRTEPTCESAEFCKLPLLDFSEDLKLKLFAELCVNSELLFPDKPF